MIKLISCLVLVQSVLAARFVPKWKKQACEIPSSQNEHSHYICSDDGEVKCLPGWNGDLCDVPKCRPGCDPLNGYCNRPGECLCKLGYFGEKCNKCIPLPGCQHGHCTHSFECICQDGWDGIFCNEPICRLDCHTTRGYCDTPGDCKCRLGWAGKTCRECQVLPGCQHGYCQKPLECKCHPGFTGILCQIPICSKTCHKERGYCRRPGECRCKVGWWGKDCEKCFPYPGCVNGDCRRPWECNCKRGWGGMLCNEELNYCEENPNTCLNGAKCVSVIKSDGNFRCLCREGSYGRFCENSEYASTTRPQTSPSKFNITYMVGLNNMTLVNYPTSILTTVAPEEKDKIMLEVEQSTSLDNSTTTEIPKTTLTTTTEKIVIINATNIVDMDSDNETF